jgi:hypothetical protein
VSPLDVYQTFPARSANKQGGIGRLILKPVHKLLLEEIELIWMWRRK